MSTVWPNLFIPGAAKSGTTALHHYLHQHSDIWMSGDKETGFFSNDERYYTGKKYYLSLFEKGKEHAYRGESSTGYMVHPQALYRIKKDTIDPKFIFILRNPIDRSFSHFNWLAGTGFESRSFKEAFLSNIHLELSFSISEPYYYHYSCYGKWLSGFCKVFGRKSIHIITAEDLKKDLRKTINTCFSFLNLPEVHQFQETRLNETIMLKNPAFYKKSMHLISKQGDNWLKDLYRKLFPDSTRIKIRKSIVNFLEDMKYNYAESYEPPQLSNEERVWLAKYFYEDFQLLKQVTGLEFSQWPEFNENRKSS